MKNTIGVTLFGICFLVGLRWYGPEKAFGQNPYAPQLINPTQSGLNSGATDLMAPKPAVPAAPQQQQQQQPQASSYQPEVQMPVNALKGGASQGDVGNRNNFRGGAGRQLGRQGEGQGQGNANAPVGFAPAGGASTEGPAPKMIVIDDDPNGGREYYIAEQGDPTVVLKTSLGDITVRLFKGRTPNTVNHFLGLVKGEKSFADVATGRLTRRPFYNGLIFHRVMKDVLIQTGCPFGNGRGGAGDPIPDEVRPDLGFNEPGMVAMAPLRKGDDFTPVPNSSSSQFFITVKPVPELNEHKFTIFGKVITGMEVVRKIAAVRVGPTDRPIRKVHLVSAEAFDSLPATEKK